MENFDSALAALIQKWTERGEDRRSMAVELLNSSMDMMAAVDRSPAPADAQMQTWNGWALVSRVPVPDLEAEAFDLPEEAAKFAAEAIAALEEPKITPVFPDGVPFGYVPPGQPGWLAVKEAEPIEPLSRSARALQRALARPAQPIGGLSTGTPIVSNEDGSAV